jgi:hypothetical protein
MPARSTDHADHTDQETAVGVNPRFLGSGLSVLSVAVLSVTVLGVAVFRLPVMFVAPLHV